MPRGGLLVGMTGAAQKRLRKGMSHQLQAQGQPVGGEPTGLREGRISTKIEGHRETGFNTQTADGNSRKQFRFQVNATVGVCGVVAATLVGDRWARQQIDILENPMNLARQLMSKQVRLRLVHTRDAQPVLQERAEVGSVLIFWFERVNALQLRLRYFHR